MRELARISGCLLLGWGLARGQTPPKVFELEIPEFQKTFDSDLIELPVRSVSQLIIHVLNPVADAVGYGKIYPKLNGEAAAVVAQFRSTARGKAVVLDLKRRPDIQILPGANTIEIVAVNQRGRRYYKNWVLRTREQARNEWFAYEQTVRPGAETASAPDLLLTEPEYPVVLQPGENARQVKIGGTVESAGPLAALLVNGKPVAVSGSARSFTAAVLVGQKDKHIVVEAADQSGNRTRVSIPVAPSATGPPPKFSGDRWALVVGISNYKPGKTALPPLASAASDAERLAAGLMERAGFSSDKVLLLRDESAQSSQIRSAFRNFVARARPEDLLVIYFAGHGVHDPNNPERIYLAAHDTQMAVLPETAIEIGELEGLLSGNVRSRNTVMLFDVGRQLSPDWRLAGSNLVNEYLVRLASREQGRAVLVSSNVDQVSHDRSSGAAAQGVFTAWILDGLQGRADWNQDRIVTVAELFRYVSDKVRQETAGTQRPQYQSADDQVPVAALR